MQVKESGVSGHIREPLSIEVGGIWQTGFSAALRTGMIFLRDGILIGTDISEVDIER